ncbi:unnamed protein product [Tetraodon nigroviridis]|uniref:Chromosome 7 SCAF14703, whole genome shotgun sequence n=1 Tax=Tetraodon nigroviridis TaxID=99883 RepID=Q4S8Q0_TETNG|nr:unnamed protein product [Tetraodon nigroviridis]
MSAGDVVCTGWLIKSPPEKKLKRFVSRSVYQILVYVFQLQQQVMLIRGVLVSVCVWVCALQCGKMV